MQDIRLKAIILIFLVSIIAYSNSLGGEFVSDDEYFIIRNITIRNLGNAVSLFINPGAVAFSGLAKDVYRPVTTLSYAIDYAVWKLDAFGYHLINTLFHSFNGMLIFALLLVLFENIPAALFTGLFFVSHPIQTEVVSWISGRSSVLFLFFYLASLIFYIRFLKESKNIYFIYSLMLCLVALFSKEMAVTLPLILLSYDIHFNKNSALRKKIARSIPYFALVLFYLAVRSFMLNRVSQCGWWGGNPYYTFLTMSPVFIDYVKLLVRPINLCVFYTMNISTSVTEPKVFLSIITILIFFAVLPFIFKRSKKFSFFIWWFLITMIPVSNVVPLRAIIAERFLYLPSIGFCAILAMAIQKIAEIKTDFFARNGRIIVIMVAAIITISYSARTMARNEDWKDCISLSRSIIEVDPLNSWGYTNLGVSYLAQDDFKKAEKALKKAIALSSGYSSPRNALGCCYLETGREAEAVELYKEALRYSPEDLETMNCLGVAYAKTKQIDKAIKSIEASIKIDPTYVNAYLNLGAIYERIPDYDKALKQYLMVELKTNSAQDIAISYIRIGDVYRKMGNKDKARDYYQKSADICARGMEELKKVIQERLTVLSQDKEDPLRKSK